MEPEKHPKPENYDQLYPGRFLKAGELLGKTHQLTIASVDVEELMDLESSQQNATKPRAVLSFKESKKKMIACKTNGLCLKAMFGVKLSAWVGKRIAIHAEVWNGKDCIRIGGSPDIDQDLDVEIKLPKRRAFKKTMRKMGGSKPAQRPTPGPQSLPDVAASVDLLASLEKVADERWAVERWWSENINAIEALSDADHQVIADAAKRKSEASS